MCPKYKIVLKWKKNNKKHENRIYKEYLWLFLFQQEEKKKQK